MRLNLIGLSGGKDSTLLVGWAIHESGYPVESLRFCFCDTENEYDEVYRQIEALDAYVRRAGCSPVVYLRASGKWVDEFWMFPLFLALAVWKGRFPSAKARFCTQFLKIKPTEKFISELVAAGHEIVSHSGVRASESFERSTMEEWGKDMFGCQTRRPLLALTLSDVWEGHKKYGLPINPLYLAGWKRVGCRLCIMSNKADVRRTVKQRNWVIAIYRTWELIVAAYRRKRGGITDYSSWFHRKTVPPSQRSKMVETKKGPMLVATIDDVARWSGTTRGGVQEPFSFMFDEESFNTDDAHAPCQSGFCE
jgi:3'-phosphoadenosine 5'-phosphosulfate sulfotransferase (PAPS reductase)/FAD synthetase